MYDGGRIVAGLGVFLLLVLFPVWRPALVPPGEPPDPKVSDPAQECVAPAETMRATHMQILNEWRTTVVRTGVRSYVGDDGTTVRMSLTGTCLNCHQNKSEFCDRCHTYLAVTPPCWNCHLEPEEKP